VLLRPLEVYAVDGSGREPLVCRRLDQAIAELGGQEPNHDSSKRFASFAPTGSIARLLVY
jgi:hypothetical protein